MAVPSPFVCMVPRVGLAGGVPCTSRELPTDRIGMWPVRAVIHKSLLCRATVIVCAAEGDIVACEQQSWGRGEMRVSTPEQRPGAVAAATIDIDRSDPEYRAWLKEAVRKVQADANRSADTHLLRFPLPRSGASTST